jgi:hypothetical protein
MSSFRRVLFSRKSHSGRFPARSDRAGLRSLRIDRLESRRLLAGLDVLVYSDADGSRDQNTPLELGLAKQVVYVDLNRNGSHDRNEPLSITNQAGVASFSGLPTSQVEVRLLGVNQGVVNRGVIQTSPVRPSSTDSLLAGVSIDEILHSLGGNEFWGRSGNQLHRFAADGRFVGDGIVIPGDLVDSAFSGSDGWLLIDSESSDRELYRLMDGDLTRSSIDAAHFELIDSLGGRFVAWDSQDGLVGLSDNDSQFGSIIEITKGGGFESFRSLGNDRIVVEERLDGGVRLSVHRVDGDLAHLEAERIFSGDIFSWTTSSRGDAIYVDTSDGVHVIDRVNGLVSTHVLASGTSPLIFDPVSTILYTGESGNSRSLRAWDPRLGTSISSLEIASGSVNLSKVAISGDGRVIAVPSDGGVVLRSVSEAAPVVVDLSSGPVPRLSIGVQVVSTRVPLELTESSQAINVIEDQPLEIRSDQIFESLPAGTYVVVLQPPTRGTLEWSVETGGVYRPFENVEGIDGFTVALFDGLNWSLPQRVQLAIQGQNDPPTAIRFPHRLEIRENVPGAIVGPVQVEDVDASASYQWSVDDSRFEIRDGILKLKDDAQLSLQQDQSVTLTVRAVELEVGFGAPNAGQSAAIEATVTLQVSANPLPGEFFVASEYSVPENEAGASLGYVYVRGALPPEEYAISVSDSRFEVVNGLFKLRDSVALRWQSDDALLVTLTAQGAGGEHFSKQTLVRVIQDRTPAIDPHDVDGDGFITPIDVLILINQINSQGSGTNPLEGELGRRIDIDGDGHVSPIDVLILINVINRQLDTDAVVAPPGDREMVPLSGEGEAAPSDGAGFGFADDLEPRFGTRRRPR